MLLALQFPNFDPILIQLGPFAIRWYALAYIVGILLGWIYAARWAQCKLWGGPPPMTAADRRFHRVVTLGIILGGRLGYVLFYNPPTSRNIRRSLQLGRAACRSTAALPAACWRWCCLPGRQHLDPLARRRDLRHRNTGICSRRMPISSMANCGAARPTLRAVFPAAGRSRATRASFTRRAEGLLLFVVLRC